MSSAQVDTVALENLHAKVEQEYHELYQQMRAKKEELDQIDKRLERSIKKKKAKAAAEEKPKVASIQAKHLLPHQIFKNRTFSIANKNNGYFDEEEDIFPNIDRNSKEEKIIKDNILLAKDDEESLTKEIKDSIKVLDTNIIQSNKNSEISFGDWLWKNTSFKECLEKIGLESILDNNKLKPKTYNDYIKLWYLLKVRDAAIVAKSETEKGNEITYNDLLKAAKYPLPGEFLNSKFKVDISICLENIPTLSVSPKSKKNSTKESEGNSEASSSKDATKSSATTKPSSTKPSSSKPSPKKSPKSVKSKIVAKKSRFDSDDDEDNSEVEKSVLESDDEVEKVSPKSKGKGPISPSRSKKSVMEMLSESDDE